MANEVNQLGQDRRPLQCWVDLDNPQKWRVGKACAIRTIRRGRRHGRVRIGIKRCETIHRLSYDAREAEFLEEHQASLGQMRQVGLLLHESSVDNMDQGVGPFLLLLLLLYAGCNCIAAAVCAGEASQTSAQRGRLHPVGIQHRYGGKEADCNRGGYCCNDDKGACRPRSLSAELTGW